MAIYHDQGLGRTQPSKCRATRSVLQRRGCLLCVLAFFVLSTIGAESANAASKEPAEEEFPQNCNLTEKGGDPGTSRSVTDLQALLIKRPLLVPRKAKAFKLDWEIEILSGSIQKGERNFDISSSLKSERDDVAHTRHISSEASFSPPNNILVTICVAPEVNGTKLAPGKYRAILKLYDERLPHQKLPVDIWVGGEHGTSYAVEIFLLGLLVAVLFVAAFSYDLIQLPRTKTNLRKEYQLIGRLAFGVLLLTTWLACGLLYTKRDEYHLWSRFDISNLASFLTFAYGLVASGITAIGLALGVLLRIPGLKKGAAFEETQGGES